MTPAREDSVGWRVGCVPSGAGRPGQCRILRQRQIPFQRPPGAPPSTTLSSARRAWTTSLLKLLTGTLLLRSVDGQGKGGARERRRASARAPVCTEAGRHFYYFTRYLVLNDRPSCSSGRQKTWLEMLLGCCRGKGRREEAKRWDDERAQVPAARERRRRRRRGHPWCTDHPWRAQHIICTVPNVPRNASARQSGTGEPQNVPRQRTRPTFPLPACLG